MAVPKDTVPSLLECQCHICVEILIEPVTLPCNHTLCKACFKSTVEKANLCCPFCRHRIIQKHYPEESRLRVSEQQSEEIVDDSQPVHLLSQPGELRREYEEERSKVEAERQAIQEEENKASEEYIRRLLAEEEERKRDRQKKALARRLSLIISNVCEESVSAFCSDSKKSNPVTTESQRKRKSKQKNTGDIQKYLSPNSQLESASQSEVIEEDRKTSRSKETDSSDRKNPTWQDTEIEEDVPALSPQICLEVQKQDAEASVESPRPHSHERESCVISHEEPKAGVSSSGEAAVKPYGETESGCTVSDVTQTLKNNTVVTENGESHLLTNKDISRAKNRNLCLKQSAIHAVLQKEEKCSSKLPQTKSKQVHFTPKLIDLERLLLALQLQKEVNQEQMRPTWLKGSPDEYQLRAMSSPPGKLLNGQRENAKERSFKRQTDLEHPILVHKMTHSLQPGKSKKSIFQMFYRYTK
ncbi:hypothetical protein FD754_019781 [Muntiacus muntjak]|uniref:RING-type E3 ubiquitin transferase n=1 Tax=Muntiacus muntjak TaxID=9888 RepID=A0A5N3V146_MUNMU|nr:hypothetical protein FD754_019781 [Muntiacus muntjak]